VLVNHPLFITFIYSLGSLYGLWQGWLRLRQPGSSLVLLAIPEIGSLALMWIVGGASAAARHRATLMQADRVRRSGYFYLLAGFGMGLAGCLALVGWLAQR